MIRLFKTNHPLVYFSLLLLALVTRLGSFFEFGASDSYPSLVNIALTDSSEFSTFWTFLLLFSSCLATWAAAILFNYVLAEKELISRSTHVPAALLILTSSLLPTPNLAIVAPFALLLLVISYSQFIRVNQVRDPAGRIFFSSFFLALSTLFFPWVGTVLILNLLIIASLLAQSPRLSGIAIVAFIMPYYFLWTGFMLDNKGYAFVLDVLNAFKASGHLPAIDFASTITLVLMGIMGIMGILKLLSSTQYLVLKLRLWFRYSVWYLLFGFIAAFMSGVMAPAFAIFAIPLALGVHFLLDGERITWWQSFLFTCLTALSVLASFSAYATFVNVTLPVFFE